MLKLLNHRILHYFAQKISIKVIWRKVHMVMMVLIVSTTASDARGE